MFKDTLSKKEKLKEVKKIYEEAVTADGYWLSEAWDDFDFWEGKQWTDEEKRLLAEELRPCLTFNLLKASVDLIMGLNEENKVRFMANPQGDEDALLCEIINLIIN